MSEKQAVLNRKTIENEGEREDFIITGNEGMRG